MFYIIAILATIFALPASAQSVKDQLVGTWRQVSCSGPGVPLCAKLKLNGILIFDASGNYASITR
jgi:hypothetical protein